MRLGVSFPTSEVGTDPAAIRDFAQAAEDLGYDHVTVIDHVIQAPAGSYDDWRKVYTRDNMFHEPFVLLGFFAAATTRIGLVTGILILPQRQTVLAAKQAAEIDVLSAGRLRLGVGLGWSAMEYAALGQDFHTRGRRVGEQVSLLRRLWTEETVSFAGDYDRIENAGLNPLPVQRPIPIWFGAFQETALRRAARLGDGWFANPYAPPGDEVAQHIALLRETAAEAGRDPAAFGIECTIRAGRRGPDEWAAEAEAWGALGATHVTFRAARAGLRSADAHIDALRRFREGVG